MRAIESDPKLIAYCGLYCGACKSYLVGKCLGCHDNAKATWCLVRSCCQERQFSSCADCREYPDVNACKKFNNFMSKAFAFLFGSDRPACIALIREKGYPAYAEHMTREKTQTIRR